MIVKSLQSRDNPFVKQLLSLAHSSRERKKNRLSVLDGIHLVEAYVRAVGAPRALAVAASASIGDVERLLTGLPRVETYLLPDALIAEASLLESPATVLAIVDTPRGLTVPVTASSALVLEDIQDPGNVGSMLRTAAAAGVEHVVMSKGCAFAWSPKVLRAGQGAHFSLNINEGVDVVSFVESFKGQSLAMLPAARRSEPLYSLDLTTPTAFLIGNEGSGLSAALIDASSRRATIPMPGVAESLNAAACAAIVLFEMVRQRSYVQDQQGRADS